MAERPLQQARRLPEAGWARKIQEIQASAKTVRLAEPWSKYVLDNICLINHNKRMGWQIQFHSAFDAEYEGLPETVQDELLAQLKVLEQFGPKTGRPRVDTLNGSCHANMKELRFDADNGVWRFAFAFDPLRKAIVLCGGSKSGQSQSRFYKQLITKADARFEAHLRELKEQEEKKGKKP